MRLGRKVQLSELAVIELGRFIICVSRLFFLREVSKVYVFFVDFELGNPFRPQLVPTNTLKATGVVRLLPSVLSILCMGTLSKVLFSIIQSVVIPMVYFATRWLSHDESSHLDITVTFFGTSLSDCIKALASGTPMCTPIPLREPSKIFKVNDCCLSARQWDVAVRFAKRLNNFVSDNTWFWHVLPLRRMCFSRYFITGGVLCPG